MKHKLKKKIVIASVSLVGITSFGFIDSYFEISKNLDIFAAVYKEINVSYVEQTNPGQLIKSGIDAMLKSLDPYTNYIPESEIEDYKIMNTQEYAGIGAMIGTEDGQIIVTEPYKNSPADQAGLRAGDVIVSVDGIETKGKNTEQLSEMLKGAAGTKVSVNIFRPTLNESLEITITRDKIKIDDVPYFGMIDSVTGYISLRSFTQTAASSVKESIQKLKSQGAEQLVLDLRGNGGGLLDESVKIVNFFVPTGSPIVETKGKVKENYARYTATTAPIDTKIPIAVLINEGTASASEIVSGTLQDLDRAVVIGQNSFGKGLVQAQKELPFNSLLKITIAKYYTPSGRCIQRLDYGHKDEFGKAVEIPDSLIKEFVTNNGRIVKDGAGITPDIYIEPKEYSDLLIALASENLIFKYATNYFYAHPKIADAKEFSLSDSEYQTFVDYVKTKNIDYFTSSTEKLKELEKVIKDDSFWDEVSPEFSALQNKLERNVDHDLIKFKPEIKRYLETEIVGRYYFAEGRIAAELPQDPVVLKALDVLHNKTFYNSVLDGTCETCLTRKK